MISSGRVHPDAERDLIAFVLSPTLSHLDLLLRAVPELRSQHFTDRRAGLVFEAATRHPRSAYASGSLIAFFEQSHRTPVPAWLQEFAPQELVLETADWLHSWRGLRGGSIRRDIDSLEAEAIARALVAAAGDR